MIISTLLTSVAVNAGVQIYMEYCKPTIKREVRKLKIRHSDDFVIGAVDWFVNVDEPDSYKGSCENKAKKKIYNYN